MILLYMYICYLFLQASLWECKFSFLWQIIYTKYKLTYSLRYNNYYLITFGYINFIENWERTSIDKRSSETETSCSWTKQTKGKIV